MASEAVKLKSVSTQRIINITLTSCLGVSRWQSPDLRSGRPAWRCAPPPAGARVGGGAAGSAASRSSAAAKQWGVVTTGARSQRGQRWSWSWSPLRTLAPAATVLAARRRQLRRLSRAETESSWSWSDNPDMSAMFDYVWNVELAPFNAYTHKTLPKCLIPYHIISGLQTASNWGIKMRRGSNNWNSEAAEIRTSAEERRRPETTHTAAAAVSSSAARRGLPPST